MIRKVVIVADVDYFDRADLENLGRYKDLATLKLEVAKLDNNESEKDNFSIHTDVDDFFTLLDAEEINVNNSWCIYTDIGESETEPCACVECGSEELVADAIDGSTECGVHRNVSCKDCGTVWVEDFVFHGWEYKE